MGKDMFGRESYVLTEEDEIMEELEKKRKKLSKRDGNRNRDIERKAKRDLKGAELLLTGVDESTIARVLKVDKAYVRLHIRRLAERHKEIRENLGVYREIKEEMLEGAEMMLLGALSDAETVSNATLMQKTIAFKTIHNIRTDALKLKKTEENADNSVVDKFSEVSFSDYKKVEESDS